MSVKGDFSFYKFFFHPLQQKEKAHKVLSVATAVFISVITAGIWLIPFCIVNRLDNRKVDRLRRANTPKVNTATSSVFPPNQPQQTQGPKPEPTPEEPISPKSPKPPLQQDTVPSTSEPKSPPIPSSVPTEVPPSSGEIPKGPEFPIEPPPTTPAPASLPLPMPPLENASDLDKILFTEREPIGKEMWKDLIGLDVGEVPPPPEGIDKLLKQESKIFPGYTVGQTSVLVLVPETVDGQPLTLESFLQLAQKPGEEKLCKTLFHTVPPIGNQGRPVENQDEANQLKKKNAPSAHWVLMTKNVIPDTLDKPYIEQKGIVDKLATETGLNYSVPSTLDAAVCILMEFLRSGTRLYGSYPRKVGSNMIRLTRCHEHLNTTFLGKVFKVPVLMGHFTEQGLQFRADNISSASAGIAAAMVFKGS